MLGRPRGPGERTRRLLAALLVALSCVAFLGASVAYWANRNLLDDEVWIARTGPTIDDPAVSGAMATYLTDQITELVDTRSLFESALPDKGRILAVPLGAAVDTFIADQVEAFVHSDRFHDLWVTLLDRGHRAAVAALRGGSNPAIDTSDGTVTVDVIPLIDAVLARISTLSPEVFGREVTIPRITFAQTPTVARERLAEAFGTTLDDDFGTFTVYDGDALGTAQQAIRLFDRLLPLTIALTAIFTVAALVVSRRRRRTALQVVVGFAVVLVVVRRLVLRTTADVVALIPNAGNAAAVRALLDAFVDPLLGTTGWFVLGLTGVAALLAVTGPYRWAVALRRGVVDLARGSGALAGSAVHRASDTAGGPAASGAASAWVARHAVALQWAGAVAFGAVAWSVDLSWAGLLVVATVIGIAELVVFRVARTDDAAPPP